MSDREVPSARNKKSYFREMEETDYGQRYGEHVYSRLQDYIACPIRKEPLIGLQYITQLCPEVDRSDAFKCSLCNVRAPLYFIMKHIESVKHRINYLEIAYKHLLPLYSRRQSFYEKIWAVREHAIKVEQQEKTFTVNDSKRYTSRMGIKSDFWKYNIKRQEKLEEYKEELSAYETQKKNILQYMETLVITSPEEATLVQQLTEEMEAAVNVFKLNTKPRHKSYKRKREQRSEDRKGGYSRHSGSEKEEKAANVQQEHQESSTASPVKVSSGNFSEATQELRHNPIVNNELFQNIRAKRIRKHSTDVAKWESLFASHRPEMNRSIFSWGPKSPLNADVNPSVEKKENTSSVSLDALSTFTLFSQERHEHGSASCQPSLETFSSPKHELEGNEDQELPCSSDTVYNEPEQHDKFTPHDVAKWESLFASHRPEMNRSIFSWCPKSPLNADVNPSAEKKGNTSSVSLDALSTFTLFSEERHEHGSASCQPSSETFSSPQHELKQEGNEDQELPCSSDTAYNESEQHDKFTAHLSKSHWNSQAETSCDQFSDVNANGAQAPQSSHVLDASSEYSDSTACGSRHLDTDSQDADSNILSNTLSGKLHASGRQLSSDVLQLFKGKDTKSIVNILKTLSPFYPALQELDLEVFAKGLSKTGAITK